MSRLTIQPLYKDILFSEFAILALSQLTVGIKKATKQDLESRMRRFLIPHFGTLRVTAITPLLVERWQSDIMVSKGADITRRTKQLLKSILDRAITYQIISTNPTLPTTRIRAKRAKEREIYSKNEVSQMIKNSNGWLRLFIMMMVSTGLRSGEMIGVKFSDIDWLNKRIYIQRNIKFGVISPPKSDLNRWVDIPTTLLKELKRAYDNRVKTNPRLADYYIFTTNKKQYWSDSSSIIKNHFKPLLKQLGIKYKTLYSLRHTYATLSLKGGQDIAYISKQLGHLDIKVTYDYYIKYIRDDNNLNKADEILAF